MTKRNIFRIVLVAAALAYFGWARDDWDRDGREFKGRNDFGCVIGDWRSLVYTPLA